MKASSGVLRGCIIVAALLSGRSAAQSTGGAIGPESRATIRISVSVMPHFEVNRVAQFAGAAEGQSSDRSLSVSLNMPGLRYTLLEDPFEPSHHQGGEKISAIDAKAAIAPPRPTLLLIIPD